ncbi:MAG TPA: CrcB family protein, partial [Terrimesophilobacter sp.]|nr:CrcB family protein [Terrimesophilobacter sp.]
MPLTLLAVFVGGAVGTGLRLGADALIPSGAFPVATLVVNVVGSFLLALLVGRAWATAPEWVKAGLGAGVLGAFTTFSAIAVSVVQLSTNGEPAVAGAYLVASVVLGIGAAAVGLRLGSGGSSTRL